MKIDEKSAFIVTGGASGLGEAGMLRFPLRLYLLLVVDACPHIYYDFHLYI
jgi:NAD(P)-dependent dehydrogenase (short-subunit alcohol dehydrogenase family)